MSALWYSLLWIAGASIRVCKRAPTASNLFANICETSCTSILVFDLDSCEAISTILLEVKVEYWYDKIDITNTTAITMAKITTLVLPVCQFIKLDHPYIHTVSSI
jgi:hypothetical protein